MSQIRKIKDMNNVKKEGASSATGQSITPVKKVVVVDKEEVHLFLNSLHNFYFALKHVEYDLFFS